MSFYNIWENAKYTRFNYIAFDSCGCTTLFVHKPVLKVQYNNYVWRLSLLQTIKFFVIHKSGLLWIKSCDPIMSKTKNIENVKLYRRPNF